MYTMYIDDRRTPTEDFDVVVRSSKEAKSYMVAHGCPKFISFDHDLGGKDTAMRVVNWMINLDLGWINGFMPIDFAFKVHSANPVGAANIAGKLNSYLNQKYELTPT